MQQIEHRIEPRPEAPAREMPSFHAQATVPEAQLFEQFLQDVAWGTLDVLVIYLPPGTGDAVLTLTQKIQLSGAVI